jgi:hypothetical protein
MSYADLAFYTSIATFGFGLSLATYRLFASRYEWPMGEWHAQRPALPILIGLVAMILAGLYAMNRAYIGQFTDALSIPAFGFAWAIFWTGLLRVGSQVSLFLAPAAASLLFIAWIGGPDNLQATTIRDGVRQEMRELREQLGLPPAKGDTQRRIEQQRFDTPRDTDQPTLPLRRSQPVQ